MFDCIFMKPFDKGSVMCKFKTSSNPIDLQLLVYSFILRLFAYWIIIQTLIVLSSPDSWVHPSIIVQLCMFPSSIHHHIIWSNKWYFLVHLIVEIHPLEFSMNCCWAYQPPPHPLLGLLMNSYFRAHFHSSFLRISQCHLVNLCCTFLLRYPESEVPWHQSDRESQSDMMVGTYFQEL